MEIQFSYWSLLLRTFRPRAFITYSVGKYTFSYKCTQLSSLFYCFGLIMYSARDCGHLPVPRNGSSSGNITTFPNEIGFVCDDGFILVGSKFRVCQENGLWSGNETFCEGKYDRSHQLEFVFLTWIFWESCASKSTILFGLLRHVLTTITVFTAVDCGSLLPPMNGTLSGDLTVFPNSVFFHCDPGFVLQGSSERACQANATWSGSSSVCEGKMPQAVKRYSTHPLKNTAKKKTERKRQQWLA